MTQTRTRVVLTNPSAWPYVRRGSETLMVGLARWLNGTGHSAEILAGGPRSERYELEGIPVRLVRHPDLRRVHPKLSSDLLLIPGLTAELRRRRGSLVHSFLYVDAAAARLAGRPYVISYGGIALARSFEGRSAHRRAFLFASSGARAIICPSEASARHLRMTFGLAALVVPNGLDTERFALDTPRIPDLIFCAATPDDPRKRIEVLVDAFGIVASQRPGAELVLAGTASPDTRASLSGRLEPRVAGRLKFLGDLDAAEVAEWNARASVACLPSLNEAFGLVVLEALAAGTPVVGASSGGIPEIVDSHVGALFIPDDAAGCAAALLEVMARAADPATSTACRQRARQYDWQVVGPRLVNLYQQLM